MPIVTFTSDFGNSDHYVAAVKAAILSSDPLIQIVDISHQIRPFDIGQMAFTIRAVFKQFPIGSIHLIGLNDTNSNEDAYLLVELEEYLFLLPDNGLIGLLSEKQPAKVIRLIAEQPSLFPTKDILVPAVLALTQGSKPEQLGEPTTEYQQMMSRRVKATRKEIAGHVTYIDGYGNLITNIQKIDFDILSKDKNYVIQVGKETTTQIHLKYHDVDPGDVFFVFNSLDLLEIGIYQGNAHQLLGLGYDHAVNIQFEE